MKKILSFLVSIGILGMASTVPALSQELEENLPSSLMAKAENKIPAINMISSNKGTVNSNIYSGKVVIFDIWASWCGPCRAQIPVLHKLQNEYGKNKLVIVGISLDDNENAHKEAIKELNITYPSCLAVNAKNMKSVQALEKAYGKEFNAIPCLIIADTKGNIVYSESGMRNEKDLKALIAPLMGKKI